MDIVKIAGWTANQVVSVVFVHGLGGHVYGTWGDPDANDFWPRWLAEDVPGAASYSIAYDAPPTNWFSTAMPLQDRATNILESLLASPELRSRPVVFVCHSLGGLLTKQVLLDLQEQSTGRAEARDFLALVKGVVFLATPHTGSAKASLLERLKLVAWPSSATRALVAGDPALRKLNVSYRAFADARRLPHLVFFETESTAGGAIVDEASADPGLPSARPIPIDGDHVAISKPRRRSDLVAEKTRAFVSEFGLSATAVDYGEFAPSHLPPVTGARRRSLLLPRLARVAVLAAISFAVWRVLTAQPPAAVASSEVQEAVTMATGQGRVEARVAGIARLATVWNRANDNELTIITRTLTELLRSESESVRKAAAEAIGDAYGDTGPTERQRAIKRLLYGSTNDWHVGSVPELNITLAGQGASAQSQLIATREAIRKNWEDLQGVHLRGVSLIGAELYEARMQGAYLVDADVRCADLHRANLLRADTTGVQWTFANVEGLEPSEIRELALKSGAVSMPKNEWLKARSEYCGGVEAAASTPRAEAPRVPTERVVTNLVSSATLRYSCPNTRADAKPEAGWIQCDQVPTASAPQQAQFSWPSPVTITMIELAVEQSPNGDTVHELLVNEVPAKRFEGPTFHRQKLVWMPDAPLVNVRTLTIKTTKSPSWWAWGGYLIIGFGQ